MPCPNCCLSDCFCKEYGSYICINKLIIPLQKANNMELLIFIFDQWMNSFTDFIGEEDHGF